MAQPINYLAGIQQPDITGSLLKGLQVAQVFGELDAMEKKRIADGELKAQYSKDLQDAFTSYSPEKMALLTAKYPGQREAFKQSADMMDTAQKDADWASGMQVYNAVEMGKVDVAKEIIEQRITAAKNSGKPTDKLELIKNTLDSDPKMVLANTGFYLSNVHPEKWKKIAEERRTEEQRPATLDKLKAEAISAGVTAEYAPQVAKAELQKKVNEALPTSLQEAIGFGKMTLDQQKTFKDLQLLKRPLTVTNIDARNIDKSAGAELGKLIPELYNAANASVSQANEIPRYRAALDGAITGPLANQRLVLGQIATALGFTGPESVNATRTLIQGMSQMALNARGALTGQGAITDAEQKLLQRATAGDINFTKGEIGIVFDVAERAARAKYDQSVKMLQSASERSEIAPIFLGNVQQMPPKQTASQVPTADKIQDWLTKHGTR